MSRYCTRAGFSNIRAKASPRGSRGNGAPDPLRRAPPQRACARGRSRTVLAQNRGYSRPAKPPGEAEPRPPGRKDGVLTPVRQERPRAGRRRAACPRCAPESRKYRSAPPSAACQSSLRYRTSDTRLMLPIARPVDMARIPRAGRIPGVVQFEIEQPELPALLFNSSRSCSSDSSNRRSASNSGSASQQIQSPRISLAALHDHARRRFSPPRNHRVRGASSAQSASAATSGAAEIMIDDCDPLAAQALENGAGVVCPASSTTAPGFFWIFFVHAKRHARPRARRFYCELRPLLAS